MATVALRGGAFVVTSDTRGATFVPPSRSMAFGPLIIEYDERVLEPRPWTRLQSDWAADLLSDLPNGPVLELCSGAGHIGLLVVTLTKRQLVAVDINPVACELMRRNARSAILDAWVDVRQGDFTSVLGEDDRFVLVVADPPWVTSEDVARYPDDPTLAIDGGSDGLEVARACIEIAERHLVAGGELLLQLGSEEQAEALVNELSDTWTAGGVRTGDGGVVLRLRR